MSPLQSLLEQILQSYPTAVHEELRRSAPIATTFADAAELLETSPPLASRPTVVTRWSVGIGRWAASPWIALLDTRKTVSTRRGVYVAYLVRSDCSGVALCVTQGATRVSDRRKLDVVVEQIRATSGELLAEAGFEVNERLDLRPTSQYASDYERGTAAFKLYERGKIPDDEALMRDLEAALAAVDRHVMTQTVAVVYVGREALSNLAVGLEQGTWGWKNFARQLEQTPPGSLLLFATGYTGGSPRRELDEWLPHGLGRLILARIRSLPFIDPRPLWPDERQSDVQYPHRVRFEVLDERHDIVFQDGLLSDELIDAIRRSSIAQSRPIVIEDSSPLLNAFEGPAAADVERSPTPRPQAAEALFDLEEEDDIAQSLEPPPAPRYSGPYATLDRIAEAFRAEIDRTGVHVPSEPADGVQSLLAALVAKPFVILTGLSGSGKTQRALRLGEWFGPDRFRVVAVRPDWTGPDSLFGYEDALNRPHWAVPETLELILRAAENPDWPYLLVLDEMNLAHVERYFSDFLSGIESRQPLIPALVRVRSTGAWRPSGGPLRPLPRNLFVIGTVNVDETTYLFSPKVLDRATTFELRTTTGELDPRRRMPQQAEKGAEDLLAGLVAIVTDDDWHIRNPSPDLERVDARLRTLHALLSLTGDEFGHRSYRESLRLAAALHASGGISDDDAIDQITLLKILPRLHGARARIEPLLLSLLEFSFDPDRDVEALRTEPREHARYRLALTASKVTRMLAAVRLNQFVSFTE